MLSPFLFLITLLSQPNIIIRISPAKSCISRKCKWPVIFLGNKINGPRGRYIICSPSPAKGWNSKKYQIDYKFYRAKKRL